MQSIKQFIKKNPFFVSIIILAILYIVFQLYLFRGLTWENYPYVHQDFWRRMEDAQFYLGDSSIVQFHAPLPSLIYAALIKLGINQIFIVNFFVHAGFAVLIFLLCKKFAKSSKAAFITSILYLVNFSIIQQANYLGLYDLFASFLITLAVYMYVSREHSRKLLVTVGVIFGLSGLVQYSGVFALPVIFLVIFLQKHHNLKAKLSQILLIGIPAGLVFGSFFVYRLIAFGNPFFSNVDQFTYLRPNISNLWIYIFSSVAFFSLPVILIGIAGIKKALEDKQVSKFLIFVLPSSFFFIFLYLWFDWRFMTYLIPIVYLFFCFGLIKISRFVLHKKYLKILAILSLAVVLIYTNFYTFGIFGIVIGANKIISLDAEFGEFVPKFMLSTKTFEDQNFPEYFLLDNDFQALTKTDFILNNFMNINNYQSVLAIKAVVRSDPFVLVLNSEKFVRYHQFNVAFKKSTVMDPTAEELSKASYIISDHKLAEEMTPVRLISRFGELWLYKNWVNAK